MSEQSNLSGVISALGITVVMSGVGLQGCSSGDSFVQELNPPSVTTAATGATVSGSASKGLLTGADCVATDTAGTVLYSSVGESTPCTNSRGRYAFQLQTNPTTPVVVNIQARSSGTQMVCDFPSGCGNGVSFGSSLDLADNFNLRAIIPSITSTTTTQEVNVSPWTEVATARAISSASNSLASVTSSTVQSSYLEVASVLNNVLSLEGSSDAFDGNFFSIDLVDIANPDQDTDIDSGEERAATLLSLASSSLFNLVDPTSTSNTSITSVVQNLATAFSSDGEFNVNKTASGIKEADNGINLADIVSGVGNVVKNIQTQLVPTQVTRLATFLNTQDLTTELASIQTAAETLAELKNSITDVALDTTKPIDLVTIAGKSDFNKATGLLIDLKNVLTATSEAFKTDEGDNTVLEDIEDLLDVNNANYDNALEVLNELIEASASMILAVSQNDTSAFSNAGCIVDSTNSTVNSISCTLPQIGTTLDFPSPDILNGTGSLVYTGSSNSVASSGTVMVGTDSTTYQVGVTGTTTGTAPLYTITTASADLGTGSLGNAQTVSLGNTSTISGVMSSNVLQSFTVDANDVVIQVDGLTINADMLVTRDTTLRDTLVTNFDLNGTLSIGTGITDTRVSDSNEGKGIALRIAFKGTRDGLPSNPTSLPMPQDETETNFLAASDILFRLETPVTYLKSTSTTEVAQATEKLVISLRGVRNAVKSGTLTSAVFRLTNLTNSDALVNTAVTASLAVNSTTHVETWGFSNATADARIQIAFTESGVDTAESTVTVVDGTGMSRGFGTVSATGTVTINDADQVESDISLLLPTIFFL